MTGTFTGAAQLSSGKFAIVEKSHEFTLVPWRPVIDRQLGREVSGIVQGGSVSWQLGRQRGLGLSPSNPLTDFTEHPSQPLMPWVGVVARMPSLHHSK